MTEYFNPADMQRRYERLKAEGRVPPLQDFLESLQHAVRSVLHPEPQQLEFDFAPLDSAAHDPHRLVQRLSQAAARIRAAL